MNTRNVVRVTAGALALAVLVLLPTMAAETPAKADNEKPNISLKNMNTDKKQILKIMPIGDSITAGYFTTNGGYRNLLKTLLEKEGLHVDFVGRRTDRSGDMDDPEHEGYSGYTIAQIETKAQEALELFHPDVVLLFAGTNDIRVNGNNDTTNSPIYWKTAPARFEKLLQTVFKESPNAVVFTGGVMPFAGPWAVREAAAVEFNAALKEIVTRSVYDGHRVVYVDFRNYVTIKELQDGIHPSTEGYRKIAHAWFDAMQVRGL